MLDSLGRNIHYLRLSITDRCNLRCRYCMPEKGVTGLHHDDVLSYEEYLRLVHIMTKLGIDSVRVTGGEPTVRRDWLSFIAGLRDVPGIHRISMTSNGILFKDMAHKARQAGLDAINISLDTVNEADYAHFTRLGTVAPVLTSVDQSLDAGLQVKINSVPIAGMDLDGILDTAELAQKRPICVRYIELMPLGMGSSLSGISSDRLMQALEERFGPLVPDPKKHGDGPAVYYKPEGFTGSIGFISALSHAFCRNCNRVRLTADGALKLCLNHDADLELKPLLRSGAGDQEILDALEKAFFRKPTEHNFGAPVPDRESRSMNAIGG